MKKSFLNFKQKSRGISMMEALVSIGLVALITMSLYSVLSGVVKNIGDSKQRIGALALGNEKMEIFRNLTYGQIGTVGGVVSGPIEPTELVERNGFSFTVLSEVRYVDDALDGFFPEDTINTDYKRVKIEIHWSNGGTDKKAVFYDNFVPNGMETNVGGGTLSINVVSYSGQAVAGVAVSVASVDDAPAVNFSSTTDNYGNLILPGVASQNYRISMSKDGYESVSTYPNPPGSAFTPLDPDIFVEEGALNVKTFYVNQSARLVFSTVKAEDDSPIPNLSLDVRGGRIIGTSPETFVFNQTLSLGNDGSSELAAASPGTYYIDNVDTLSVEGYQYIGCSEPPPFTLAAVEDKTVSLLFANKDLNSLVVILSDAISTNRIEGAEIRLTGTGFAETLITGKDGIVYFPMLADPTTVMAEGDYHLEIIKEGYVNFSKDVHILKLLKEEIAL